MPSMGSPTAVYQLINISSYKFAYIYYLILSTPFFATECSYNRICIIPESVNTNILHQLFDYTITFVNSQPALEHKLKRSFCTQNPVLNVRIKGFWYTKINPTQIWYDKFN